MQRHPQSEKVREQLRQCLPLVRSWHGTFYRATSIEYANRKDLLAGTGARQAGGRWNPPARFNAVYGSLDPETAMAEPLARYREFGIPLSQAMPLVFVAVTVKLQAILDMTSSEVQRVLGISTRRMTAGDWLAEQDRGQEALTQAIGRAAWETRLEGLLVPSARRRGGHNIVLFPSRRMRGSSWKIQRARRLQKRDD